MSDWFTPLYYFLPISPSQKSARKEQAKNLLAVFTLAQLAVVDKIKTVANVLIQVVDKVDTGLKNKFTKSANPSTRDEDGLDAKVTLSSHSIRRAQGVVPKTEWYIIPDGFPTSPGAPGPQDPPGPQDSLNFPDHPNPAPPPNDPSPMPPESLLNNSNPFTLYSTLPKNPLLLLPAFLLALYKSEEKIIQNINVHVSASPWSKVYQIGFGNKNDNELSIAFEVKAGAPIRLLHEDATLKSTKDRIPIIFKSANLFNYLPIPHCFIWKREKRVTDCNIFIDDPGNPLLQDGPVKTYIPLSSDEGFHLIHRDPKKGDHNVAETNEEMSVRDIFTYGSTRLEKVKKVGQTALSNAPAVPLKEIVRAADIFSCAGTNTATIQVNHMDSSLKSRTEFFPLPFYENPNRAQEFYLKVTQIQ